MVSARASVRCRRRRRGGRWKELASRGLGKADSAGRRARRHSIPTSGDALVCGLEVVLPVLVVVGQMQRVRRWCCRRPRRSRRSVRRSQECLRRTRCRRAVRAAEARLLSTRSPSPPSRRSQDLKCWTDLRVELILRGNDDVLPVSAPGLGGELGWGGQPGAFGAGPGPSFLIPSDCHIRRAGGVFMSITSTGGAMASTPRIPKARDSTRRRPARCPGGASRPCPRRSSVTSWSTPRR